jgi:transcription initiation factor TFIIIB Brf1 subunit/transcription initiation factor TFIIB
VDNIYMAAALKEHLGQPLTSKQLAKYLGVDEKTIRKYYRCLGGIRLGRLYLFFERSVINAIQKGTEMDSPSKERGDAETEEILGEERSSGMGNRAKKTPRKRLEKEDRHALLA